MRYKLGGACGCTLSKRSATYCHWCFEVLPTPPSVQCAMGTPPANTSGGPPPGLALVPALGSPPGLGVAPASGPPAGLGHGVVPCAAGGLPAGLALAGALPPHGGSDMHVDMLKEALEEIRKLSELGKNVKALTVQVGALQQQCSEMAGVLNLIKETVMEASSTTSGFEEIHPAHITTIES